MPRLARAAAVLAIAAAGALATIGHAVDSKAITVPDITTVDADVTGFGTFQSHNQKVVSTPHGIFMTYVKTAFDGATWRLMRSADGGATFQPVWEAVNSTHAPALEAASDGTLYLVHGDQETFAAYLYRFSPLTSFAPEPLAVVDGAHAQKFSLLLDEARGKLYYAAYRDPDAGTLDQDTRFIAFELTGAVSADYLLTGAEQKAKPSYPRMLLDGRMLYVAWSSDKAFGDSNDYYSIHTVRSPDGGVTWQNLAGKALIPPFVGDQGGHTTEVTLPWERPCTTWLTGFAVTHGKAHFFYLASPNASLRGCPLETNMTRHQRFDLARGVREADIEAFAPAGVTFDNVGGSFVSGFFATSPRDGTLFLVSQTADNRLALVASHDDGETWRLVSQTEPLTDHLYAIGGQRLVDADGKVLGSFTHDSLQPAEAPSAVRFFRAGVESVSTKLSMSVQVPKLPAGALTAHSAENLTTKR